MAAIAAPFTGQQTEFYVKSTAHVLGTLVGTDLVGEIQNIGDIELSTNIIEISSYGSDYKGKLAGQKDSGTVDISLNWIPGGADAAQDLLQSSYSSGAEVFCVIVWKDGGMGVGACEFKGIVESYSISQPLEDVVTVNVTVNIIGGVTFDVDGTLGAP